MLVLLGSNVGLPVLEPLQVGSGYITLHSMHVQCGAQTNFQIHSMN